jgi:hypothetical protein
MNPDGDFLKVGESLRPEVTSGGAVDKEDGVLEKWHMKTSRDSVDEYLEMRAKNANGLGWRLLDQAPDVPPLPGDELCEE